MAAPLRELMAHPANATRHISTRGQDGGRRSGGNRPQAGPHAIGRPDPLVLSLVQATSDPRATSHPRLAGMGPRRQVPPTPKTQASPLPQRRASHLKTTQAVVPTLRRIDEMAHALSGRSHQDVFRRPQGRALCHLVSIGRVSAPRLASLPDVPRGTSVPRSDHIDVAVVPSAGGSSARHARRVSRGTRSNPYRRTPPPDSRSKCGQAGDKQTPISDEVEADTRVWCWHAPVLSVECLTFMALNHIRREWRSVVDNVVRQSNDTPFRVEWVRCRATGVGVRWAR